MVPSQAARLVDVEDWIEQDRASRPRDAAHVTKVALRLAAISAQLQEDDGRLLILQEVVRPRLNSHGPAPVQGENTLDGQE
jgi:hypothetical protein